MSCSGTGPRRITDEGENVERKRWIEDFAWGQSLMRLWHVFLYLVTMKKAKWTMMEGVNEWIGKGLRGLRKKQAVSQEGWRKRCGLHGSHMAEIERGS